MSYSKSVPIILDEKGRNSKAEQILSVLESAAGDLTKLNCLDVGSSSGVITKTLAKHFKSIVGVDIDTDAIELANKKYMARNIKYQLSTSDKLDFNDNTFDVVIFNQVYEFADNPKRLVSEIYRVLKKGGLCFVGARNKYALVEGQTGLPLLHFLPYVLGKHVASVYGKGYYKANYMSQGEINELFKKFKSENLTLMILKSPSKYGFNSLEKYAFMFRLIPDSFLKILLFFIPNFILICRKSA